MASDKMNRASVFTRRNFLKEVATTAAAAASATTALASSAPSGAKTPVIDGMMHLEVYKSDDKAYYWDGLIDDILEHYEKAGVDQGVILTTWTPTRESNDRTLKAYEKHPDRFIPFGHVRPEDAEWRQELKRIAEPPWKGLKLHEGELRRSGGDLRQVTRNIVKHAADSGIHLLKIHLEVYPIIDELTREFRDIIWILPHMGCYRRPQDMEKYCRLARNRENVYLDTAGVATYYQLGKAILWAGVENITFASDGFMYSPLVEISKIKTLQLPTPYRTPRLSDQQIAMVLGGNMAGLLGKQ